MGIPHKSINQSLQDLNDDDDKKAWIVIGIVIFGLALVAKLLYPVIINIIHK